MKKLSIVFLLSSIYLMLGAQDKWSLQFSADYVVQPFNQFNLVEEGGGYFDVKRSYTPAFQIGGGVKRNFGRYSIGLIYQYMNAKVDYKLNIVEPVNLLGEPETIFEPSLEIDYNQSSLLGLSYQYHWDKLSLGTRLNIMSFDYSPNNIPSYDDNYDGFAVSGGSNSIGEDPIEYSYSVALSESFDLGEFKSLMLVPELFASYEIINNLNVNVGLYFKFWSNKTAYRALVEGFVDHEAENILTGQQTFNDIQLKNRLVAPRIGLSYDLGFSKLKFWKK